MTSLAQLTSAIQHVLIPSAEEAARHSGSVRRVRRFSGSTWVQTLVVGCLHTASPTLTSLAQTAALLGVGVTPQAIAQRFTPATVACLQQVLECAVQQRISADPVAIPVLNRFTEVAVLDTTTVALPASWAETWPGCGNGSGQDSAALKLGVRLDLRRGTLTGPLLETGRTHDRCCAVTEQPLPPGSLRLADLGFWSVPELGQLAAQGVFWLCRLQAQTTVLNPDGTDMGLDHLLTATPATSLEREIRLSATTQLPARLLAVRVPAPVAEERRRRIRADAKRRGHTPRQSRLHRADWQLLVTNVPAARLSVGEAMSLMRARWQIELLFKQWKQDGRIDEVRSSNRFRFLAEVYAKLIGMVIQHWLVVRGCWSIANRSYPKAAGIVRTMAIPLGQVVQRRRDLTTTLDALLTALGHSGTQNPRRTHPNLSQLLADLTESTLS